MTTKPTLPATLSLSVLSRWIDLGDEKNPRFKFQLELTNEGRRMSFEYSGGILAFMSDKTKAEIAKMRRWGANNTDGFYFAEKIMQGTRFHWDMREPRAALDWMLSQAVIDIHGVIYCLFMDSDALDYSFEEWAENLGFDEDSRKAEETYNLCRRQSKEFVKLIGRDKIEELKEAFQDY